MAKVVDPDQLNQATEVVFDKINKTIQLLIAGNLNDTAPGRTSGVSGQAVYSFCKEEWLTDATLNELKFPFDPIFEQKLVLVAGWSWADAQTTDLLRDVGWKQVNGEEWAGLQSLGNFNLGTEQAYYQQIAGFDATADASVVLFDKTGEVNEAAQIKGPSGTPDYSGFLKVFLRPQAKTYAQGELKADQALSAVDYRFYGVPLTDGNDITDGSGAPNSDGNIDTLAPYTGMVVDYLKGALFVLVTVTTYATGDVVQDGVGRWAFCTAGGTVTGGTGGAFGSFTGTATWEAYAGELLMGATYYAFNRIVNGNGGTAKEIYEWLARQARKTTDINNDTLGTPNQNGNGAQFGRIANTLAYFIGDVLHSQDGVALTNFDANATNNIRQHDITIDSGGLDSEGLPLVSTARSYPFVAAGTFVFSQNLVDEINADTLYKMFFEYSVRETNTDVAVTASAGATMTLTSTAIDLSTWLVGEFMYIQGFTTNPTNNGMYYATGTPAANAIDLTKVDGITCINEVSGDTVSLDHDPYDSPDAIVTNNNSAAAITGQITAGSIAFDFDYTNNNQGGRTPNTPADVVVMAQGIPGARWVDAYFQITAATGLNFPVNAANELVYSNP